MCTQEGGGVHERVRASGCECWESLVARDTALGGVFSLSKPGCEATWRAGCESALLGFCAGSVSHILPERAVKQS